MKAKLWFWAAGAAFCVAAVTAEPPAPPDATLVFTGDIGGYLSPCGCTKPQIGGIRRMAGVIRALLKQPNTFYVDNGNWSKPGGRQEELKAEAIAELFRNLNASFVNVGNDDSMLSEGLLRSLQDATGGRLGSTNLDMDWVKPTAVLGGKLFVVGVVSGEGSMRKMSAAEASEMPAPGGLSKVVLLDGSKQIAESLARSSDASLVVYSVHGDPTMAQQNIGKATVVTVGDHGRYVAKIELRDGKWTNLTLFQLGPEHQDDAAATKIYTAYLQRVTAENLIAEVPRSNEGSKYVGSKNCISCHGKTYKQWKTTAHSHALPTLETTKNDKDPDCVGCHVVGLDHQSGFRDMKQTPAMANVGCESCHGAGYDHAKRPRIIRLGKAGQASCAKCHNTEHSPTFNFASYWKKIKH